MGLLRRGRKGKDEKGIGLDGDFSRQGPKFNCLWIILLSGGLTLSPVPHGVQRRVLEVKLLRKAVDSENLRDYEWQR